MFDPFNDFESSGYLRNARKDKDPVVIKHMEHNLLRANLKEAFDYLSQNEIIEYADFLEVHKILFGDYYPWAVQAVHALGRFPLPADQRLFNSHFRNFEVDFNAAKLKINRK
jgi:hypothetical protein